MPTIGTNAYPAYVYDADTDTWVPIGVGAHTHDAVPLTTVAAKGDLLVGTANDTISRVAVGTNNFTLLADSAQTTGVKWAASPTSVLGTTGDILYASSANTLAALAAGTSGYALTANGAGVAPSWQAIPTGSMTLISRQTPNNVSGFSFTSIPQTYTDLYIRWVGYEPSAVGAGTYYIRFNSDATATAYNYSGITANSGSVSVISGQQSHIGAEFVSGSTTGTIGTTLAFSAKGDLRIENYANTSLYKTYVGNVGYRRTDGFDFFYPILGTWASNSAITSFDIVRFSGTFNLNSLTGSYIELWGVK